MTDVEDRIRAATRAAAGQVRVIRPLDLPDTPAHWRPRRDRSGNRWAGWAMPLAAAAAVVAVALGLVIARQAQSGPGHRLPGTGTRITPACGGPSVARDSAAPALPGDVPRYFVELCGWDPLKGRGPGRLVAADLRTGAVLGSVPASFGKYEFTGIYGTAGDRAFVVSATEGTPQGPRTGLWMLRLAPGAVHPVSMAQLPWTLADRPFSLAVSPDGTKIAVSLNEDTATPVRIYSLATGAVLRAWRISGIVDSLQWTGDGRGLAYQWNGSTFAVHDIAAPGSDLPAGSTTLLTLSASSRGDACSGASDWSVSANGTTIICPLAPLAPGPGIGTNSAGACPSEPPAQLGFVRFTAGAHSPGTAPAATDYSVTANPCGSNVSLWWASPDGTEVIGQVSYPGHDEVGVFRNGTYTPLPALGAGNATSLTIAF